MMISTPKTHLPARPKTCVQEIVRVEQALRTWRLEGGALLGLGVSEHTMSHMVLEDMRSRQMVTRKEAKTCKRRNTQQVTFLSTPIRNFCVQFRMTDDEHEIRQPRLFRSPLMDALRPSRDQPDQLDTLDHPASQPDQPAQGAESSQVTDSSAARHEGGDVVAVQVNNEFKL